MLTKEDFQNQEEVIYPFIINFYGVEVILDSIRDFSPTITDSIFLDVPFFKSFIKDSEKALI